MAKVIGKVKNARYVFNIYDLGDFWYKVVKPLSYKKHKITSGTLFEKKDFDNKTSELYKYLKATAGYKRC